MWQDQYAEERLLVHENHITPFSFTCSFKPWFSAGIMFKQMIVSGKSCVDRIMDLVKVLLTVYMWTCMLPNHHGEWAEGKSV